MSCFTGRLSDSGVDKLLERNVGGLPPHCIIIIDVLPAILTRTIYRVKTPIAGAML
jgi:hypothetical protein